MKSRLKKCRKVYRNKENAFFFPLSPREGVRVSATKIDKILMLEEKIDMQGPYS